MRHFPLLIFDWDGTLVDSIERIVTSLQFASEQTTGDVITETQARNVIGLGLMEAVAKLHPQLHEEKQSERLNKIADAYRQHYLYDNTVPAPLFSGVTELL
jgi:phosphoglycolate phosphatase